MELQNHKLTRLKTIVDAVEELKEEGDFSIRKLSDFVGINVSHSTNVIVLERNLSMFDIYRDLMRFANGGINTCVSGRNVMNYFNQEEHNVIEDTTKQFLRELTQMNEWLLNCGSLADSEFKTIEDFDRIEIKRRLQRLLDIL